MYGRRHREQTAVISPPSATVGLRIASLVMDVKLFAFNFVNRQECNRHSLPLKACSRVAIWLVTLVPSEHARAGLFNDQSVSAELADHNIDVIAVFDVPAGI